MSAFTIQSYNLFRGRCPHLSVFLPQKEIICSCDKMTLVTMPHKRGVGPAILYIQGNNYLFIIIYIASPFLSNDTVIFVILSQTSRKLHFAPTKVTIPPSFSCQKELPVSARNPEPPKSPSLLPQNRTKCPGGTFLPPRQKLALYGVLKRAVKIL